MEILVETTDGFIIAEEDLKMRGPGDLMGTQQSGILDLKIADITKDDKIMKLARDAANDLIAKDADLTMNENQSIRNQFLRMLKNRPNWSRIS
jgi:ATP-dependent DNA helicase RecG